MNGKSEVYGWTALHFSARYGHTKACQAILACKEFTEVNARDNGGRTALHVAARYGNTEACQAILACKEFTEVNAKTPPGGTTLHIAADNGHADTCKVIQNDKIDFRFVSLKTRTAKSILWFLH